MNHRLRHLRSFNHDSSEPLFPDPRFHNLTTITPLRRSCLPICIPSSRGVRREDGKSALCEDSHEYICHRARNHIVVLHSFFRSVSLIAGSSGRPCADMPTLHDVSRNLKALCSRAFMSSMLGDVAWQSDLPYILTENNGKRNKLDIIIQTDANDNPQELSR